jgi:hypothetical protein
MTFAPIAEPPPNSPWKPASETDTGTRLDRGIRKARVIARDLGHVLGEWHADTAESAVATCLVCEDLAAVDATQRQPTELLGHVLTRPCPGDPIW